MKPHQQKNRYKTRAKKNGKIKGDKKTKSKKEKRQENAKSKKRKRGGEFFLTKGNKRKELKIKIQAHELLASTLSSLMLAPW
jgi:hypothetical protein